MASRHSAIGKLFTEFRRVYYEPFYSKVKRMSGYIKVSNKKCIQTSSFALDPRFTTGIDFFFPDWDRAF